MAPTDRTNIQNAWVVTDLEEAARSWHRMLGIGPFFMASYPATTFTDLEYRGAPGELTMMTAIAYSGTLQIELIQPLGDAPNAYRDVYAPGAAGFHHVCFWTDDLEADLAHYEAQGAPVANVGRMAGGPRFAYVDTRQQLGCMVELLERHAGVQKLFDGWHEQSRDWTGTDPIVRL